MGMDDDSVVGLQSAKLCGEVIPNIWLWNFADLFVMKDPFFDKNKPVEARVGGSQARAHQVFLEAERW